MELLNGLLLEAEFKPDHDAAATFFTGLKPEVKPYMVRQSPDNFRVLRTLMIILDKECSSSYKSDQCNLKAQPTNQQSTLEVMVETLRIGVGLSKEEREKSA